MNPLHLSGWGLEVKAASSRVHQELMIEDGHSFGRAGERYLFPPRQFPHDSVIVEAKTGHISIQALHWLSKHNVPVFVMAYDGSIVSSILPPMPVKADLRVSQIQAATNPEKKFSVARAFVQGKLDRSLEF
jgi:CRISPR-associated protein Cas1